MNKAILTLLVVVIIGVGFVAYIHSTRVKGELDTDDMQTQRISVSMICNDDSYFIAEFPTSAVLEVVVNGELKHELPQVEGSGYRFENTDYTYVFAGEGVTVTDKATNTVRICAQPFDPNLAPFNFGDVAEGGGDAVHVVTLVAESLVDRWQSADDATFIREFSATAFVDYINNNENQRGTWSVSIPESQDAPIALGEEQLVHLDIATSQNGESTIEHFVVTSITADVLTLVNKETKVESTYHRL